MSGGLLTQPSSGQFHQPADAHAPPSGCSVVPVMYSARSDARNNARAADVAVRPLPAHRDPRGDDPRVGVHRHALGGRLVGRDRVDPDPVGCELERERAREVGDRALHARVDRVARRGAVTLDRRDADDAAAVTLRLHLVGREVRGVQQPAEVHADDRVPPPHVGVDEVGLERAAGDVHQRVELAEARQAVGERLAHRVGVAHVDRRRERLLTGRGGEIGDGLRQQLLVAVEEHEVHARLGEVLGDGAAEAAPAARRSTPPCPAVLLGLRGIPCRDHRPRRTVARPSRRRPQPGQADRKRRRVMPSPSS